MSTIKVDTIATRTGSGNITASNTIVGNLTGNVTGDTTGTHTGNVATNSLTTQSGTTITIPTGKTLVGTDAGTLRMPGSVVQVATYTTNASLSGTIDGQVGDLSATAGTTWHTVSFAPKTSSSKLLFQMSNVSCHETANNADGFWATVTDGTTLYAATSGTIDYVSWNSAYNGAVISFNHTFNSWGTSTKNLQIRFGAQRSIDSGACHVNIPGSYANNYNTPANRNIGISITEIHT